MTKTFAFGLQQNVSRNIR